MLNMLNLCAIGLKAVLDSCPVHSTVPEWQGLKDVVVPNNLSMELQIGTLQLRLDGDDGETCHTRRSAVSGVDFCGVVSGVSIWFVGITNS